MDTYTTITPKFQVHIPVAIRKKAGFTKHGRVKIRAMKNKIVIEAPKETDDILYWAGKFKVKNPIPAEKIRDYIEYGEDGRF